MHATAATGDNPRPRPLVIPVFIPHAGCPHRCVFCNQAAVTGEEASMPTPAALRGRIETFLSHRRRTRHPVQIAFYGGNFLGLPNDTLFSYLTEAAAYVSAGAVDSLRFSTRPDTITEERLDALSGYPVATIEIGAQSMSRTVLKRSRRGHTPEDTAEAVRLLKYRGYETGVQLMVGLPAESRTDCTATGEAVAALQPHFTRIYPTVVLAGSPLAKWYREGRYLPLSLEEAIFRTQHLWRLFHRSGIAVIRMGLQAADDPTRPAGIIAGPYHPAFGHLVVAAAFLEAVSSVLAASPTGGGEVTLRVNPRSESKMRGMANASIDALRDRFGLGAVRVAQDSLVGEEEVWINDHRVIVTDAPGPAPGSSPREEVR